MTEANDLATAATDPDPRIGLRAAVALRRLADALEVLQVDNARLQGWSWQEIADALDVSRQAVHKKHAGRKPVRPTTQPDPANDRT
ncbi:helix-turn-helix domain-containing protein [Dactylosporangium roseum]|uniref:Helix-turn-helix domain-containing protein n=1 Tax=Dactylosporangium roseum TaxID=47989 RepID=A0ABY5Z0B4_9ACTN|nr:helix-turn-helix domain-containing protein [Dactylosporangium roseum]UWZ35450.1 helix-turn-helix domain-containing protein [Dactylosporangium roseum]